MEKKLFRISGKHELNDEWSRLTEDFIGYIIFDVSKNTFIGYTEERYSAPHDATCYISGVMIEEDNMKRKLIFVKLSNEDKFVPLLYTFDDATKLGTWQPYIDLTRQMLCIFFTQLDNAQIFLKELPKDETLKKKISNTFQQVLMVGLQKNLDILEEIEGFADLLQVMDDGFEDFPQQ